MKFKTKYRWKIILHYVLGWTLAFLFLSIVRGVGTIEKSSVAFEFWETILVSILFGLLFGSISGYTQILTEERIYKQISIAKLLLVRVVFAFLFLSLLIFVSYLMVTTFFGETKGFIAFVLEPGSPAIYFYILCVDIFMFVFRQISLLIGEKNLGKVLSGKFYTPREEERIFMFLDLQSSTTHAEKLGHITYSKMIQECFNDLGVVLENEAEVYQYVGDEVILTWNLKAGLRNQNCINAYYNFKKQLAKKREAYKSKYNCAPFFKAGLHSGIVTVTEVGKYKKEIAYHGDTINTAARIQSKCNEHKQELLISDKLKNQLNGSGFIFNELGSLSLRGKLKEVFVYAVSEKDVT
ncbi:adenylate cyclase [Saonia flava]|uniref:Adenylate cyclase n=1 Tax=Saonia flava TaxID=523696 RepID=A0A846QUH5_9FLAO|nr:adenylate/guanylate cyclase domain-containing protein [Saonia flava]NJB69953.1 adenylate cyclase [Saonia flava]